ncbi:MAG: hypothetical protein PXY39_06140, partial [archaeon]|nr:hypothetical protein [archaeon]
MIAKVDRQKRVKNNSGIVEYLWLFRALYQLHPNNSDKIGNMCPGSDTDNHRIKAVNAYPTISSSTGASKKHFGIMQPVSHLGKP